MSFLFPETGVAAPEAKLTDPGHSHNWRELLTHAANLLEQQGWVTGAYVNDVGAHCAVGAMNAIIGREVMDDDFGTFPVFDEAYLRLAQYIRAHEADPEDGYEPIDDVEAYDDVVQEWNDSYLSSDEGKSVIKAMRECASAT